MQMGTASFQVQVQERLESSRHVCPRRTLSRKTVRLPIGKEDLDKAILHTQTNALYERLFVREKSVRD
jgi:hypothetical protein